jgi:uncharacterized membrane protein YraQ (UPF0718 family)
MLARRAEGLSALAHPSRLLIVEALEDGEMTVSALTGIVGSDISTVSRHLAVLRSAGILASGMGNGPALALLLAGPALSLPNMLVIRSVLRTARTLTFVALVVVMATVSGIVFGAVA